MNIAKAILSKEGLLSKNSIEHIQEVFNTYKTFKRSSIHGRPLKTFQAVEIRRKLKYLKNAFYLFNIFHRLSKYSRTLFMDFIIVSLKQMF